MTHTSVFCKASIHPAAYPNGRPRTDYRRWIFSACAVVLAAVPPLLSAEPQAVTLTTCKGKISSSFGTLGINAEWAIDWIDRATHIPPVVMTAVHKQICADTFGLLSEDSGQDEGGVVAARLDYAQIHLFRRAADMVKEPEDSHCARALDFHAYLNVLFVTDGYIGYKMNGLHNEGGNGCHSFVIARVLSLASGRPLSASDLIATNRFSALYAHIVNKACAEVDVKPFDPEPNYKPSDRFFDTANFMIEPKGIRWYLSPYSVFPGCAGVVDTLVSWDELKPFFAELGYWSALRKLHAGAKTILRKE
ncbi:MAG: DUF3298 domain-containing protein [bacterium]